MNPEIPQPPQRERELTDAQMTAAGLVFEHSNDRREIYVVNDLEKFLEYIPDLGFDASLAQVFEEQFALYPDGMKKLFYIYDPKDGTAKLGDHMHRPVAKGGLGVETMIFLRIPETTNIVCREFDFETNRGSVVDSVQNGDVIAKHPDRYHAMEIDGPLIMMEISEAADYREGYSVQVDPEDESLTSEARAFIFGDEHGS